MLSSGVLLKRLSGTNYEWVKLIKTLGEDFRTCKLRTTQRTTSDLSHDIYRSAFAFIPARFANEVYAKVIGCYLSR